MKLLSCYYSVYEVPVSVVRGIGDSFCFQRDDVWFQDDYCYPADVEEFVQSHTCETMEQLDAFRHVNADIGSQPLPVLNTKLDYVFFTTISIFTKEAAHEVNFTEHFLHHIRHTAHMLDPIIFAVDKGASTCQYLRSAGLPCNDAFPAPRLRGRDVFMLERSNTVTVDTKFYYALQYLKQGKNVLFSDNDAIFLQNPMHLLMNSDMDMYGLSDFTDLDTHTTQDQPYCPFKYGWPCQSTGLWAVKSNNRTIALFEEFWQKLVSRLSWNQELFSLFIKEKVHPTAVKSGHIAEPMIKYGLFPATHSANINVCQQRCKRGLPIATHVIHMGYVHGLAKYKAFMKLSQCLQAGNRTLCQCL